MTNPHRYHPVGRPYAKRYRYKYTQHAFDKLRSVDLTLAEFQQLLGAGEVIAEAVEIRGQTKELELLAEWHRPLHVVLVLDDFRQEERLVTVYEPKSSEWTIDLRRRR